MRRLEWLPEYSVGVEELDAQHRSLHDTFNKMIEEQKEPYDAAKFSASLRSLIHYAYVHFATEEHHLTLAEFPGLKEHVIEHVGFIMKTMSLATKVDEGDQDHRIELLLYLREWFATHVLGADRKYIPYLAAKGAPKDRRTL
jgi:hemerythrin